jgi:hypothetical protein
MLTIEDLKSFASGIFAARTFIDDGSFTQNGLLLKMVAVRGNIYDWCIYVGKKEQSFEEIAKVGDKISGKYLIKRLVPCDEEAFKMYRY